MFQLLSMMHGLKNLAAKLLNPEWSLLDRRRLGAALMFEPETSTPFIASPDTSVASTSTPPIIRWIGMATVGLVVFVISVIAYFAHERSVENRLSAENSQLTALLKET